MKRSMKKALALLMLIATMVVLQACSGSNSNKLDGTTWKLTKAEVAGQEMALEQLGLNMELKFSKDTVVVTMLGESAEDMKYTVEKDLVKISSDDGTDTLDFNYDGKTMTFADEDSGMTMILEAVK